MGQNIFWENTKNHKWTWEYVGQKAKSRQDIGEFGWNWTNKKNSWVLFTLSRSWTCPKGLSSMAC